MTPTRFGLCTWTLGLEAPDQIMEATRRMGVDGVQFHGDHKTHDPVQVRKAADAAGLTLFAVDPINCSPQAGDTADAAHGVDYYKGVVDFAAALGCDTVTAHGLGFWCKDEKDRSGAFERLVEGVQALCDHAAPKGIRILWEMCNRYEVPMVRSCKEGRVLQQRVDRANFAQIVDSFHMNIEDHDPLAEIRATGRDIAIYHLSDSNRAGVGSGHIDFRAHHLALRETGFDGPVMLEFVLPWLCPHTPPETQEHWQALQAEFTRSLEAWRSYDADRARQAA